MGPERAGGRPDGSSRAESGIALEAKGWSDLTDMIMAGRCDSVSAHPDPVPLSSERLLRVDGTSLSRCFEPSGPVENGCPQVGVEGRNKGGQVY